jgi:hypothetical protein
MEITINNEDIERIIKDSFEGVTEVKIVKPIKILVSIDPNTFVKKQVKPVAIGKLISKEQVNAQATTPAPELTLEEKNEEARKKGLMMAGGSDRTIINVG